MGTTHKSKVTRFHLHESFSSTGVVGEDPFILNGETSIRVIVRGSSGLNSTKIQARLSNDTQYVDLLTITGDGNELIDVSTYDEVRFNVITYGGSPGQLIASGFYTAGITEPLEIEGAVTGSFSPSGLTVGGSITSVSLDDTAWVALPPSVLTGRNNISIQNISGNGGVVLYNYSASAPATVGWRIEDGGHKSVAITDSIIVYGRMLSGLGKVIVDEVA